MELCLNFDLKLPAGESGEYNLIRNVYLPGTKLAVIPNNFQSMLMGNTFKEVYIENDFVLYDLFRGNERVMTNSPLEMYKLYIPYLRAKGNVFIGGYGMGVLSRLMCMKGEVENVTALEISEDIIKLCGAQDEKLELLQYDLFEYLRKEDMSKFDYIFIDIHISGDKFYPECLIPTRTFLLENYPTVSFDFWQEDMLKMNHLRIHKKDYLVNGY